MLVITVLRSDGSERTWDWTVEDSKKPPIIAMRVLEMRADGNELDYIKELFSCSPAPIPKETNPAVTYTIPMPRETKSVTWIGDIAATIYANL